MHASHHTHTLDQHAPHSHAVRCRETKRRQKENRSAGKDGSKMRQGPMNVHVLLVLDFRPGLNHLTQTVIKRRFSRTLRYRRVLA